MERLLLQRHTMTPAIRSAVLATRTAVLETRTAVLTLRTAATSAAAAPERELQPAKPFSQIPSPLRYCPYLQNRAEVFSLIVLATS
jgi:hypothetical protein